MSGLGHDLAGRVLVRGEDGYEDARRDAVFNGRKPDRFPDAIVIAETDADCVAAVRAARDRGWRIGVRSGGHSWSGNAVRDGGLLLDLSRLTDIEIDTQHARAVVGPGVRGADLQAALNKRGYYFPTGGCPTVAIAGFILGGGASWTGKFDGPACFSLAAIDVVTADGELVRADDEHHPDLVWAARGGGPNFFGVVTRFHLDIKPLPAVKYATEYIYPLDVLDEFLEWNVELIDAVSGRLSHAWLAAESPIPNVPGKVLLQSGIAFAESEQEARRLLEPLESSPLLDRAIAHVPPRPWDFPQGYALLDRIYAQGRRYRSDALWVNTRSDGFVEAVRDIVLDLPTTHSHFLWSPLMSEGRHVHPNAAYSMETELSAHVYGVGESPTEDDVTTEFVDGAMQRLLPHSNGAGKVNDCDLTAFPKAIMSSESAERLERVRDRYDPERRFHCALGLEAPEPARP